MRSPSARNRPSARRWRFSRSSRIRLTSGFERLSIWERRPVIRSILAEAVLDQPDQLEQRRVGAVAPGMDGDRIALRSEEHTSELQSLMRISYAVFCLKKQNTY